MAQGQQTEGGIAVADVGQSQAVGSDLVEYGAVGEHSPAYVAGRAGCVYNGPEIVGDGGQAAVAPVRAVCALGKMIQSAAAGKGSGNDYRDLRVRQALQLGGDGLGVSLQRGLHSMMLLRERLAALIWAGTLTARTAAHA